MNREKNYNKIFNANPHVGVLDPLISKVSILQSLLLILKGWHHYITFCLQKKKVSETGGVRYSSAPSLVSPLPTESLTGTLPAPSLQPRHQLAPLTSAGGGSSSSSLGSTSGGQANLSKKEQAKHSSLESKPRRLMMLQDSPLSQEKLKSNRTVGSHHLPLHPIETVPSSISQKKTTLLVQ